MLDVKKIYIFFNFVKWSLQKGAFTIRWNICFLERPRECGVPEKAKLFGVLLIGAQVVYVV